jgi:hypothetical protein
MNDTLIFQVPMSRKLRDAARAAAKEQGFSSLQEYVRVMVSKLSTREIGITFDKIIKVSPKTEKRYIEMKRDFDNGKGIVVHSVDEMMNVLHDH